MYKNIIQCKRSKLNILIQTNTWPIPILNQAFHIIMYNGNQEFAEMIRILASAEGIYVDYLNEEHYADDENQLLFIVCEAVSHIIDVYSFDYTVWHGGMIARGDLAIAILAGTRVGKSTFIANFLASEEYQYLSDDIILYDEMENRVIPYPIPLKLRELTYIPRVLHARMFPICRNVDNLGGFKPPVRAK